MRKLIGAIVAVVAALAITGAALAAVLTPLDPSATYTPLGGTVGHQTFPITATTAGSDCADTTVSPAPGQTVWHFVLTQSAASSGLLRADFVPHNPNGGVTVPDVASTKLSGTTLHWYVVTPSGLSLQNVSSDVSGDNLNLSHFCVGKLVSHVTTEIHKGATDSGKPDPVTGSLPLGSSVHDSAAITVDSGNIPAGSTVKFTFYDGANNVVGTETDNVPSGSSTASVDPALAEGPLHAGSYHYTAAFTSGDSSVADSTSANEPLTIDQAKLVISTQIHGVNGAHDPVGGSTHVALGSTVHDTATVSVADGGYAGFNVPGASEVSFTLNGNAVAKDSTADGTATARTIESDALAAGDYTYSARVSGNSDYIGATSDNEPLTVDRAQLTVSTVLHGINGAHNDMTNTHQRLGSTVHDTATISGQVAGFTAPTTADISFTRDGSAVAKAADESAGVASTVESAPLAAGSYVYKAHVDGNSNYIGADSPDEPLTIDKAQLAITTAIHDGNHNVVTSAAPGSSVHDTATVTGQVAGFDIGAISFTLNGNAVANGSGADGTTTAHSVDSGPLQPGSYTYNASVAENANYLGATSANEPLSVNAVFGKTMGFWGNSNGQARIIANGGYTANAVAIGRGSIIDTQPESLKILPNQFNACGKGSPLIFSGAGAATGTADCTFAAGINKGTLNTAAAQTLALGYNIKLVANFSGQTLGAMGVTPVGSLTAASTVDQAFAYAVSLINGSVPGGSTTQSQLGALNTMLGSINREA